MSPNDPATATAGASQTEGPTMPIPAPGGYTATTAPYPERKEDATADTLIRYLTAGIIQRHTLNRDLQQRAFEPGSATVRDPHALAAWAHSLTAISTQWALTRALRTAKAADPAAADQLARDLWAGWEQGPGTGEAWEWAAEAGIDAERIEAEERAAHAARGGVR